MKQITICEDCKYRSYNDSLENCTKCGGRLEIIASEMEKKQ